MADPNTIQQATSSIFESGLVEVLVAAIGFGGSIFASMRIAESKIKSLYKEVENTIPNYVRDSVGHLEDTLTIKIETVIKDIEKAITDSQASDLALEKKINEESTAVKEEIREKYEIFENYKKLLFQKYDSLHDKVVEFNTTLQELKTEIHVFKERYAPRTDISSEYLAKETFVMYKDQVDNNIDRLTNSLEKISEKINNLDESISEVLIALSKRS